MNWDNSDYFSFLYSQHHYHKHVHFLIVIQTGIPSLALDKQNLTFSLLKQQNY